MSRTALLVSAALAWILLGCGQPDATSAPNTEASAAARSTTSTTAQTSPDSSPETSPPVSSQPTSTSTPPTTELGGVTSPSLPQVDESAPTSVPAAGDAEGQPWDVSCCTDADALPARTMTPEAVAADGELSNALGRRYAASGYLVVSKQGSQLCSGLNERYPPGCAEPYLTLAESPAGLEETKTDAYSNIPMGDFTITSDPVVVQFELGFDGVGALVGLKPSFASAEAAPTVSLIEASGELPLPEQDDDLAFQQTLIDLAKRVSPAGTVLLSHDDERFLVYSVVPVSPEGRDTLTSVLQGTVALSSWLAPLDG